VSLAIAPLSYVAGPHSFAILTLGGPVIVVRQFDVNQVLGTIETYRVTDTWLPPTALYLLLESPDVRRRDLSSLRYVQMGTAAVSPDKLKEAIELLGPCISQIYGQIESGFVTTLEPQAAASAAGGDHPERLGERGTQRPCQQGRHHGRRRTIAAARRNWRDRGQRQMRQALPGRGGNSGSSPLRLAPHPDVGYLDESGFLYIVGRMKDVVNMAGLKIPAAEIERVIMELPQVRECAVIAVPDRHRGEVPKAIVSFKDGEVVTAGEHHRPLPATPRRVEGAGVHRAVGGPAEVPGREDRQASHPRALLIILRYQGLEGRP
jgi:acyl-coenzyme A synthetase/AMP-(fatty) acid ligase